MKITIFQRNFFGNTRIIMTNGHQTHQTLILLITVSGELCLNATRHFSPSQIPLTSWRKSCKQYAQNSINKAVLSFITRLRACVKAGGRHFEHVFK